MLTALASQFTETEYTADEDFIPYAAPGVNPIYKSAHNVLAGMFPSIGNSVAYGQLASDILARTVAFMSHIDQKFNMSATFDAEHYNLMEAQAHAFNAWLDSPDGTPKPDILAYSPALPESEDENETSVPVAIRKEPSIITETEDNTERKPRGPSKSSGYQKALEVYKADQKEGKTRKHTVDKMIAMGIAPSTATVYYSKFKHA